MTEGTPLFDTSRKALTFALNHSRLIYAQPLMTKVANMLDPSELGGKLKRDFSLGGLDGAAQAGLIYTQLNKLTQPQIWAVVSRAALPSVPCACRSPCCMGEKPNPEWVNAIRSLDAWLAELPAEGKSSKSNKKSQFAKMQPVLRRKLIEKHFGRKYILADLAEEYNLTEATIINYRKPISLVLNGLEKGAWTDMDHLLTELGLVGGIY